MAEACALLLGLAVERERFLRLTLAAEETRTSEQMKSTLLAQLAHDLKTPVAAARGAIENWEAASGGSDASRLAGEQLKALSRRVTELMDVVRLDSGAARPRPERVGCGEIVEAAVARFGEALADHTLVLEPPPPDVAVEVDPAQLTEALGHGLENAARYSPAGLDDPGLGRRRRAGRLLPGDRPGPRRPARGPRPRLRAVRPPRRRAGRARQRPRPLHRAKPRRLERRTAPPRRRRRRRDPVRDRASAERRMSRVLVADDEPAIRKVVRDAFEREGHEVVAAIDGQEALERFEEGGFDLVVTDLAMPNLGGLELVQEIRREALRDSDPRADGQERGAREGALARRGRRRFRDEALRRRGAARPRSRAAAAPGAGETGARALGEHRGRTGVAHGAEGRPRGPPDPDRVLDPPRA